MDLRPNTERTVRARTIAAAIACSQVGWTHAARADHVVGQERTDYTAYTLQQNDVSLGVLSAEYGLVAPITVGTYLPPWFAFPWLDAPVANGFVKVRDWFLEPLTVAVRGAVVYFKADALSSKLTDAGFFAVPVDVFASLRVSSLVTQSVQVTYVRVGLTGEAPSNSVLDTGLGAASLSSASMSTLTELRLSPVVALTLRGNLLLGQSDLVVNARVERDATLVRARLGAPRDNHPFRGNIIPGAAFSWSHVNLYFGLGYGHIFVPVVELPTNKLSLVPDANFNVRF